MRRVAVRVLLVVAGAVLSYIGVSALLSPRAFYAANGILLADDPSLLSEVRAPAGLLVVGGIVAFLGALRRSLTRPALAATAVVHGSYGLSRLVGVALDGMPAQGLVAATLIELLVGGLSLAALVGAPRSATRARPGEGWG